jgi:hypothetical protein
LAVTQSAWCKDKAKTDKSTAPPVKVAAAADQVAVTTDPAPEKLIAPPQENRYFPIRADGQPFVLNIDTTINLTSALDRFYYDPRWRGEVWTPFDQVDEIERATRLLGTWPEYNEANIFRVWNASNIWFEKYSGFGP